MNECLKWEKPRTLSTIQISSGTMEAIKWIALMSMTIDHYNRFFYNSSLNYAYCIGRLALPLFAFIFAYNLAQPDALARGLYPRVLKRLVIFGILATPGYIAMRHLLYLWPLNIMFMLGTATAILYCLESEAVVNRVFAVVIFLLGGFFVEYNWVGLIFCMMSWFFCKKPNLISLLTWLIAYLLLDNINGNNWALTTLPLIFLATKIDLKIPRVPYFFYIYYPLHLSFFCLISRWI